jgi:putative alpha-1,2-mannosidase
VYFAARFSRPFSSAALAADDVIQENATELGGEGLKAVLDFGNRGGEVLVKVGISAVDVEGARRNLEAELPGWDFDRTRENARKVWNKALGVIEVEGGTPDQRTIFYTALYHSLLAPNTFSDFDGRYRGMDGGVHQAHDRRQYTVFSLWDTFRATHPLLTIIEPERTGEFINTMLAQYQQGGRLPVWELAGYETDTMIGYHSVSVIADAFLKGIGGFNPGLALDAMVDSANTELFGLDTYRRQGFIGAEAEPESVSKTLEYAYDDWCIATMADALGRDDIARQFRRRSQGWRHLLDPETGLMRARINQRWIEPFDPRRVDLHYTEANAWQYSFFVPHDLEGLIAASGGVEAFDARLDTLFATESRTTGRHQVDITGLIGQYAHGNEPSHHVAWLYHYAGRPDKSQDRVRQIIDTLYTAAPDGLAGNEDCGQMSSWYVLSAIGLYPVCPGRPEYVLGAPVFPKVTFHLPDGQDFVIHAAGAASFDYVRSADLDGQPISRSFLRHDELVAGGKLELQLGPEPGDAWGRVPADRPRSAVEGPRVVAAPFAVADNDLFRDGVNVELRSAEPGGQIRYSPPEGSGNGANAPWTGSQTITQSTSLRFWAETPAGVSPTVEAYFHRVPVPWRIEVVSRPNTQYTGGGPDVLIDGRRGPDNWRLGGWQGFQYTDFEAVVDLLVPQPVRRAGASFIQDVRPWIWMPTEVVISVSVDGVEYREVGRVINGVAADLRDVVRGDLVADLGGVDARFVRIVARNFGTIPDWHPGRGDGAFIFVDEILIE